MIELRALGYTKWLLRVWNVKTHCGTPIRLCFPVWLIAECTGSVVYRVIHFRCLSHSVAWETWKHPGIPLLFCGTCAALLLHYKHSESALPYRYLKWTGTWCVQCEDMLAPRFYSLCSESFGFHKQSSRSVASFFPEIYWSGLAFRSSWNVNKFGVFLFKDLVSMYSDCRSFWKRPEHFGFHNRPCSVARQGIIIFGFSSHDVIDCTIGTSVWSSHRGLPSTCEWRRGSKRSKMTVGHVQWESLTCQRFWWWGQRLCGTDNGNSKLCSDKWNYQWGGFDIPPC